MEASEKIHEEAIIIDALVISNWSREVFEDMHRGGLTAANCTCSVWEGFRATMANIARWKRWLRENKDILTQVYAVVDIERAKRKARVGIILGFQNTYAFEDRLENIALFYELGVRFAQITYNTRNLVGSGCWESRDDGLSDYGREVVEEMNRTGMVIDLSHVGPRTTEDVIEHSRAAGISTSQSNPRRSSLLIFVAPGKPTTVPVSFLNARTSRGSSPSSLAMPPREALTATMTAPASWNR